MKPVTEEVKGSLYAKGDTLALLLHDDGHLVFLRYGLPRIGTEKPIFPALVIDDWGRERRSLQLYRWIFEHGERFPRAEIFGYDVSGRETQIFLRALEIYFKYHCLAYHHRDAAIGDGKRLQAVLVPDPNHNGPARRAEVPPDVRWPLQHAAVEWFYVNPMRLADDGWEPAGRPGELPGSS